MEPLFEPCAPELLVGELASAEPLTRFRGLDLHAIRGGDYPIAMAEIGRVREESYREVGAGRGAAVDLDAYDHGEDAYQQLLALDPSRGELVAVLRYQEGRRAVTAGEQVLRTSTLFEFSPWLREEVIPCGIELGRLAVRRSASRAKLGLFAIWQGLAQLARRSPDVRYFFGNVSVYRDYKPAARARLVSLVESLYRPPRPTFIARPGLRYRPDVTSAPPDGVEALRYIDAQVAERGERVPPMLRTYLSLGSTVCCGETVVDRDFAGALEIGIVVPLRTIDRQARERFGLP
ncbi:MAG: GNAT family N-acyltransferase [Nannocystaceae bacterium]|nr:GNAT family N-acetyltransferase [Myxococcales bacterium]